MNDAVLMLNLSHQKELISARSRKISLLFVDINEFKIDIPLLILNKNIKQLSVGKYAFHQRIKEIKSYGRGKKLNGKRWNKVRHNTTYRMYIQEKRRMERKYTERKKMMNNLLFLKLKPLKFSVVTPISVADPVFYIIRIHGSEP